MKVDEFNKNDFDVSLACKAQKEYTERTKAPHFASYDGKCWRCGRNIYEPIAWPKYEKGSYRTVPLDSPEAVHITGITVERAGNELVTGCPHCNKAYDD